MAFALSAICTLRLCGQNTFPASGNVGIGTSTPAAKLEIINYYSSGIDSLRFNYTDAGNSNYQLAIQPFVIGAGNVGYRFSTSNLGVKQDTLFLTGDGRVGVGTYFSSDRLSALGSIGVYTLPGGGIAGNHYTRLTAGNTPGLVFCRSVQNWSDTWWQFAMGSDNALRLDFCSVPQLTLKNGLMGIKTDTPQRPLDVNGTARLADGAALEWGGTTASISGTSSSNALFFATSGVERMRVDSTGNIGIGTVAPTEKLSVNGKIRAKELVIETIGWPDFVFRPNYALISLGETERFINQNGHLPGMPSATEAETAGVSVGDMQKRLLQKLEEMVLHQITLEKRISQLEARNTELEKRLHEN
ncbi:hypothetical protein [Nibricoccus sp. IMCC34717]|uniref:hypothetical protein n=1 Tax=Nibricoccus sp. IMCC34717 TaxID=3034021 RepID=UPI00384A4DEA